MAGVSGSPTLSYVTLCLSLTLMGWDLPAIIRLFCAPNKYLYLINNKCSCVVCFIAGRWAGHVARMGERRGVYRVLVGKPEGKRPLGRPRRRWQHSIKMDFQEVVCGGVDWIELAQDGDRLRALVTAVMNLGVP